MYHTLGTCKITSLITKKNYKRVYLISATCSQKMPEVGLSKYLGVHNIILSICIQFHSFNVLKEKLYYKVYKEKNRCFSIPHKLITALRKPPLTPLALLISVYNTPTDKSWFFLLFSILSIDFLIWKSSVQHS